MRRGQRVAGSNPVVPTVFVQVRAGDALRGRTRSVASVQRTWQRGRGSRHTPPLPPRHESTQPGQAQPKMWQCEPRSGHENTRTDGVPLSTHLTTNARHALPPSTTTRRSSTRRRRRSSGLSSGSTSDVPRRWRCRGSSARWTSSARASWSPEMTPVSCRAFYNVCSHRGSRLCEEPAGTTKEVFQCPYHAWCYNLNGDLVVTPRVGDDEVDRSVLGLKPVHVDEWQGFCCSTSRVDHQCHCVSRSIVPAWRR